MSHKTKKTHDDFLDEVFNLVGDEYKVLGEYTGALNPITMKHISCGYQYAVKPNNFLRGRRCPKCKQRLKRTTDTFKKDIYDLVGREYDALGEYVNLKTKIKMKHNECGHIWSVTPHNFLRGKRCPRCCRSTGEKAIFRYLEKKKIKFKSEYSFSDLRNKRPLRFDFAVFDGEKLLLVIEFDGEQHLRQTTKNRDQFEYLKKLDEMKNEYCLRKGIKLVRLNRVEEIPEKLDHHINRVGTG